MHSRFPDRLPLSLYILHPSLAVLLPFLPFSAESELQLQYVCVLAHINTQCFLKEKERGVFRREAVKRRRNREYEYFLTPKKEGEGREEGGGSSKNQSEKKVMSHGQGREGMDRSWQGHPRLDSSFQELWPEREADSPGLAPGVTQSTVLG